jgi:hypothetical protein
MAELASVASPKQAGQPTEWYAYYAGFREQFVADALHVMDARREKAIVLDPWNGSGTTTCVSSTLGIPSHGLDLNPALTLVAKGRTVDPSNQATLQSIGIDLVEHAREQTPDADSDDALLSQLLGPQSSVTARSFVLSIERVLGVNLQSSIATGFRDGLEPLPAFYFVALFQALRSSLSTRRTSNPTWTKVDSGRRASVSRTQLERRFATAIDDLAARLRLGSRLASPTIQTASSRALPLEDRSISHVVSSPPYCTRIDYAVVSALELGLLGFSRTQFKELREQLLGTPLTGGKGVDSSSDWGETALSFLARVRAHDSRASKTYYSHFFERYFSALHESMLEIDRVARRDASMTLVIQDSFYKEHRLDLARVVREMAGGSHWRLVSTKHFPTRTMAALNPATRGYRASYGAVESVVLFQRAM